MPRQYGRNRDSSPRYIPNAPASPQYPDEVDNEPTLKTSEYLTNQRDNFTQIPNEVLRDPNLSAQAKTVYAVLLSYAWQKTTCFPGHELLCHDTGIKSDRTLRNYLAELRDYGLVTWVQRGLGKSNIYTLHHTVDKSRR